MINVKELTDIELNRAMIWLYPPVLHLQEDTGIECFFIGAKSGAYLQDWNLTMPLAVENKLYIQCHTPTVVSSFGMTIEAANKNPLRAIAEVLVMLKLEGKQ